MALFALGGCMSMAPSDERRPMPVAATYPDAVPPSLGQPLAAQGWRHYFVDPRLQALIAQALENNRDLRIAVSRVEETRATYGIQRAEQFPGISAVAEGSRTRVPADLSATGKPMISDKFQVGLGLTAWELDFWGRVRSLKDAALENYLAANSTRHAVALSMITQVANRYLALRELDERLALARKTSASRSESLRIFRRRVEVGSTSRLDMTQVEALWLQAKALSAELEQARAVQANALTLLVGAPTSLVPVPGYFDDAGVLGELHAGLPSGLLLERPDIVAAEHQLKAANANIGAARAAFFPRITLIGSYGTASAELDGLFKNGSAAWSFAPSITLPLFDGWRNRSNLDLSWARRNTAVAQYEKAIQSAFRDVADALAGRKWLGEQVQILHATVGVQAERARLAKLRYDNGAAAFLEVLDAQRDLLTVQQQVVQARRALLSSRVNLYAALGSDTDVSAMVPDTAYQSSPKERGGSNDILP
ncbi:efflux transporter outer membrane subunit [Nitratidesulfovibrio sp.]|uniref:efflux transporter outer membrane subunit n=1 Tax=Nitratidesulfovibrio sp. TaxID=2802297 RepID=UPI003341596A